MTVTTMCGTWGGSWAGTCRAVVPVAVWSAAEAPYVKSAPGRWSRGALGVRSGGVCRPAGSR
ncbi:hypothetical protein GCM10026982_27390 [Nocardiopsis aegyptia]